MSLAFAVLLPCAEGLVCYGGDCPQLWSQTHMLESGHFNLTTVCPVTLEKPLPLFILFSPEIYQLLIPGAVRIEKIIMVKNRPWKTYIQV